MIIVQKSQLSSVQFDLLDSARSIGNIKKYCDHAFTKLYEVIKMESASLNLCLIKDNMMLSELKCYLFKQPEKIATNYEKISQVDFFTPILISLPRNVFHARDLISEEDYYNTDLFKTHCCYFDLHNAIAAGAKIPGHKHKYIVLYLYSGEKNRLFTQGEMQFLDGISPVFFSTILYQLGLICEETLVEQVTLINTFSDSPEIMRLIKMIIAKPTATRKGYAKELGKSPNTLNKQFQTLFEKLEMRENENNHDNWNMKFKVFDKFYFLKH